MMYNEDNRMPYQPDNPSDAERHMLARSALEQVGRPEDFAYILQQMLPPPEITSFAGPGRFKNIRVGVIGGGLAGMATAFELRKLGFDITIFEALESRVGGRVYTHYFNSEKTLYAEFGPMRMPVTHETLWHYINLFGLNTRPFIQVNEDAFIFLKNVRVRNDPAGQSVMQYIYPKYNLRGWEQTTPWQQLVYHGLEAPLRKASPQVRSEILEVKPLYHPAVLYWDGNKVRSILQTAGLSENAIDLLVNFSPLAGQNLYNSYIDYAQELYSVDLAYLYEIPGGTARLSEAFYNSLASPYPGNAYAGIPTQALGRVTWQRGCHVDGIYWNGDRGKVTLAYGNKADSGRQYAHFDYAVCAIPFSTLRTTDIQPLFGNRKMQAIREVDYINAQKTFLLCNRRFWEENAPFGRIIGGASFTDLPISQIYYPSDHAAYSKKQWKHTAGGGPSCAVCYDGYHPADLSRQPGVLLASYNFNLEAVRLAEMPERLRFEKIKREVERVHGLPPGYLESIVSEAKTVSWGDEPWFRGALCYYTPEQKQLFSYASAVPEFGSRVFFAGEHISAKHRWMQGSLKSGMEAANALAAVCSSRQENVTEPRVP